MAKILVTGASGFVGRHILQTLMEFPHPQLHVVAATRDASKLPTAYTGEVRVGDLRDPDYLDRVLTGIDIICHTAGWTNFHQHQQESQQLYLEPTIDLINRAREWRVARFVNLSSIGVAAHPREQDNTTGRPRHGCAMLNCMIAVEDYLKTVADNRMSVINLRAGIYCGKDLRTGLLPLLLQRPQLPLFSGHYGYLPLVSGQDLAQAFVRAALLPDLNGYTSLNIVGPDTPTHREVIRTISNANHSAKNKCLPAWFARPAHFYLAWRDRNIKHPLVTRTMTTMLQNPVLNSDKARNFLGYQAQIGWQASLDDFISDWKQRERTAPLHADLYHTE